MYSYQQIKFVYIIVVVAVVISFLSANRSNERAERNDTYNYYNHYVCGVGAPDSSTCKSHIGSSKIEVGYDYFSYSIGNLLGPNTFWYYKLITALFINLVILLSVYFISGKSILPVIWLLLDYRYYAYSSNMLRHGLALAISLLAIYAFLNRNKIKSLFISLLALLFHISSGSMLIKSFYKLNIKFILLSFFAVLIATSFLSEFIISNRELFLSLNDKSVRYIESSDGQIIRFPIQYIIALSVGLFFYKKTDDPNYIAIYNILFSLVICGLLISTMGLLDRITSFMTPLIYVLMFYIYSYLMSYFKDKMLYILLFNVFFIVLLGSNLFSNFYMVLIYFNAY